MRRAAETIRIRSLPAAMAARTNATAPNTAAVAKTSVEIENRPSSVTTISAVNVIHPIEPWTLRITRYTAIGIGKTSTRFRCDCICPTM